MCVFIIEGEKQVTFDWRPFHSREEEKVKKQKIRRYHVSNSYCFYSSGTVVSVFAATTRPE